MQEIILGGRSLVGVALSDAGLVLFGTMLVLFGATLMVSVLLKKRSSLFRVLTILISVLLCLWIGMISLDFSGVTANAAFGQFADFSAMLSTHRFLLVPIPFFLLLSSLVSLIVYGEKIADRHADVYRHAVIASVWISFTVILFIGFESMF